MTINPIQKPADVPLEDTTKINVDWLKLDRENPRLVGISARTTDESIVAQLYRGEELGSRLIDRQSQNMTVAARATADRKVLAHLS